MQQSERKAARLNLRCIYRTLPKRAFVSVFMSVAAVALIGYHLARGQETEPAYELSRAAQQGKALAPVPLVLNGKSPQLVYRGSYLVNAVAGCNSCHTCPSYRGIDPFKTGGAGLNGPVPINTLNYLAGGTPFENGIIAPNLTPDANGNPGGLTLTQFKNAMQKGVSSHNSAHILQVMPWPIYRGMDNHDLVAIYQYLKSIPQAPAGQCTGWNQTR
jgi:hypothetical protein